MKRRILELLDGRWFALIRKEFAQIRRNPRLVVMLIIPPTLNIVLFGFALNPTVTGLKLGVVDECRSAESRELIAAMTESKSFAVSGYYESTSDLGVSLGSGEIDAGIVIPGDFDEKRLRNESADVQIVVGAVNSNTATIAAAYATGIVALLNRKIAGARKSDSPATARMPNVEMHSALLYNPGLVNSWFIAAGLIGGLLVMQGSVVAAGSMVREKEDGTIEQLLMTPAGAIEIITAKMAPIFLLMAADIVIAVGVARLVFGLPFRGSFLLFFGAGCVCVIAGIGIGTLLSTFARSQQQALLMIFFVNPPLILLSGATTPIEAMPKLLQTVSIINPVRHFAVISRGVLMKGAGVNELLPDLIWLCAFAAVVLAISIQRFRSQLQ